jgi:hypothetical protein
MSWSTYITASTDIQEKDIDDIVDNLPEELSNTFIRKNSKQSWGWSCGTDIYLPEGKKIMVRGAGYSAHLAEQMTTHIKTELRKKDYKNVKNSRIS